MISLSQTIHFIPGLVCGLQQPALTGSLSIESIDELDCDALVEHIQQLIRGVNLVDQPGRDKEWLATNTIQCLIALFRSQQIICSEKFHLIPVELDGNAASRFEFFLPYAVPPEIARECFTWIDSLVELHSHRQSNEKPDASAVEKALTELHESLGKYAAPSINRFEIARAAFDLDIPIYPVNIDLYYLGQGSRSVMLSSSFTEQTPAIAAQVARNKFFTAEMLKNLGLPAPQQVRVADERQAQGAAQQLGFPVVVKAADLEEGRGVFPALADVNEVSEAFRQVAQLSKRILVEKHVEGRTHRFTVFQGRVIKIVQRIPGSVTGDGSSTINQLIEQAQGTRRMQYISKRQGHPALSLDKEAQSLLEEQGLTPESVPQDGQFVPLRKTDNASTGGTNKLLHQQDVHPDNLSLAVDAARTLRLDFAGIDLIIADVSKSWLDQQAIICEINAQPTTGAVDTPDLYQEILSALLPEGVRVPVHLAILPSDSPPMGPELLALQEQLGCHGMSCRDGLFFDGKNIRRAFRHGQAAAKALLLDQQVKSALCVYDASEIVQYGMFTDRFSSVKILGTDQANDNLSEELKNVLCLLPPETNYEFIDPRSLVSDA